MKIPVLCFVVLIGSCGRTEEIRDRVPNYRDADVPPAVSIAELSREEISRITKSMVLDSGRVQQALGIAQEFWGRKADVKNVEFRFFRPGYNGYWDASTKTIFLNVQFWTDDYLASVMTHEYGHALGKAHSYDPTSVMFAVAPESLPERMSTQQVSGSSLAEIGYTGSSIGPLTPSTCTSSFQIMPDMARPPVLEMHLPENQCDWKESMGTAIWTFRIEGKEYEITGKNLAEAVKVATPAKELLEPKP